LEDLEQQFLVGDQVYVMLGENKGRTGSIVEINDGVSTIVEGMANQVINISLAVFSILLALLLILPVPIAIVIS
jgi:ribosomal protein S4E